jgi:hypothetical protein
MIDLEHGGMGIRAAQSLLMATQRAADCYK